MNYALTNFSMRNKKDLEDISNYHNFMVNDIAGAMELMNIFDKEIIFISTYGVTQEEKDEIISDILKKFNSDKYIICTASYISTVEFPPSEYYLKEEVEPDKENKKLIPVDDILKRDTELLEKHGFININGYTRYEYKEALIYGNKTGNKIAEYLNKFNK